MKLAYVYQIKPTSEQVVTIKTWLELPRRHFNYALSQRLNSLHRIIFPINCCSRSSDSIEESLEKFPSYNVQVREVKQTKAVFPSYKNNEAGKPNNDVGVLTLYSYELA